MKGQTPSFALVSAPRTRSQSIEQPHVSEPMGTRWSMPRQRRRIDQGLAYHLISRFVDREWFIEKTAEREHYLKLLGNSLENSDWRLTAYAIMSNHIHLECIAGTQLLANLMRPVHAPFADGMNRA